MKQIRAIAFLTLKEAVRNKILYLLFFVSLFLVSCSWVIGQLTVGDETKIIKDMGISVIHFFGVLIAVFIGIGLIFRELEKRTVYLVLSKPLKRYQFLIGKFLGLAVTLLMSLIGLVAVFYILLALKNEGDPRILIVFFPIYLEWLLMAGIAILFSSFSTPLLSTMLTLAAFVMGHLSESLLLLRDKLNAPAANVILAALFYALPNLELFNIRTRIVHSLALPSGFFAEVTLYWALYLSGLLLLSIRIFDRKDLV